MKMAGRQYRAFVDASTSKRGDCVKKVLECGPASIIIQGKAFKKYDDAYYVSEYGDVYSMYTGKILKHLISEDGHHRVDLHGKHVFVHKLVYSVWVGEIPPNTQVNHYDDDKGNNHYTNLYCGTQKDNIADCLRNKHRVGNLKTITVYDMKDGCIHIFRGTKEFLDYDGEHSAKNLGFLRCSKRNWFRKRYVLLAINRSVSTIESSLTEKNCEENKVSTLAGTRSE